MDSKMEVTQADPQTGSFSAATSATSTTIQWRMGDSGPGTQILSASAGAIRANFKPSPHFLCTGTRAIQTYAEPELRVGSLKAHQGPQQHRDAQKEGRHQARSSPEASEI